MTLADFGAAVLCDASTVSKIEAGLLRPTKRFVGACVRTSPNTRDTRVRPAMSTAPRVMPAAVRCARSEAAEPARLPPALVCTYSS
jgi:hypothetical protein